MIIGTIRQFMPKQDGVPIGGIVVWNGEIADIPRGFYLCDGTNNTPDLSDQFVLGASVTYPIDDIGGEENVTLLSTNMPEHTHGYTVGSAGDHTHTIPIGATDGEAGNLEESLDDGLNNTKSSSIENWMHNHTDPTISNAGSNLPHNNMPPYLVLAYIMRGR